MSNVITFVAAILGRESMARSTMGSGTRRSMRTHTAKMRPLAASRPITPVDPQPQAFPWLIPSRNEASASDRAPAPA